MPSPCKAFYQLQNIFTNRVWPSHQFHNMGQRRKQPVLESGASVRALSPVLNPLPFAFSSQQVGTI